MFIWQHSVRKKICGQYGTHMSSHQRAAQRSQTADHCPYFSVRYFDYELVWWCKVTTFCFPVITALPGISVQCGPLSLRHRRQNTISDRLVLCLTTTSVLSLLTTALKCFTSWTVLQAVDFHELEHNNDADHHQTSDICTVFTAF